jgi:tetratricopeptide (TPR) repeat protein
LQEKAESVELKQALQRLMYEEEYARAVELFEQTVEKRPDVLLENADLSGELRRMYQTLSICMQEEHRGVRGLVAHSHDLRELIPIVAECEGIVSRIYAQKEQPADLAYLQMYEISWVALAALALNLPGTQGQLIPVLNALGMYFFREKCYDKVIPFLDYAYGLDQGNRETRSNLVTVLEALGEADLAKSFACD